MIYNHSHYFGIHAKSHVKIISFLLLCMFIISKITVNVKGKIGKRHRNNNQGNIEIND